MSSVDPSEVFIERCSGLIEAEVDGEMVALHVENGQCYGFNGTATRIWSLLANPMTLAELCNELVAEFDLPPQDAPEKILPFLQELKADGLISMRTKPAA